MARPKRSAPGRSGQAIAMRNSVIIPPHSVLAASSALCLVEDAPACRADLPLDDLAGSGRLPQGAVLAPLPGLRHRLVMRLLLRELLRSCRRGTAHPERDDRAAAHGGHVQEVTTGDPPFARCWPIGHDPLLHFSFAEHGYARLRRHALTNVNSRRHSASRRRPAKPASWLANPFAARCAQCATGRLAPRSMPQNAASWRSSAITACSHAA